MIAIGNTQIKKVYLGNNEIKRIYKGSKIIYPYDAEIEYLESSGTQYINFPNIIPTGNDNTFETKITYLGYTDSTKWKSWFGTYVNEQTNTYRIIRNSNSNTAVLVYNGSLAEGGGVPVSVSIGSTYNIRLYPTYVLFNDTRTNLLNRNGNQNTSYLRLFTVGGVLRFYNFKYTKGNEILLDCVPVRVGQVGYMYDKVSGQLFGNSGSGNFILGNDI